MIGGEFDHRRPCRRGACAVDLRPAIAALETAGLIDGRRQAARLRYRFTHALTQEVCYDSLVGHQRKTLHGAIGRALESTHARPDRRTCGAPGASLRAAPRTGRRRIQFGRRAAERAIALSQFADALVMLDQCCRMGRPAPPADTAIS